MGALYRSTLNTADIINAATVTLVKGQYVDIGVLKVSADEYVGMGYGDDNTQDSAQGRIYFDAKDNSGTPVAIQGMFRIYMTSSQQLPISEKPVVIDIDLAALANGSNDRSGQIPFPFNNVMLSKDKEYHFQIMNTAASAQTLSLANSKALLDITRQLV